MKKVQIIILVVVLVLSISAAAQDPVHWNFSTKKIAEKTYQINFTAKIDQPWHIYSQLTHKGGPLPTKISFAKNPLIVTSGAIREVGKLETTHEEVFDVDVKYFSNTVDFVQIIKLRSNVKTNLTGNIQYQVCTGQQCLSPTSVSFDISLQ